MKKNSLSIVIVLFFLGGMSLSAQQYVWSHLSGNLAGGSGLADGGGSVARFSYPNSVAVDSSGVVYVADTGNNTIRKLVFSGTACTVITLAGTPGVTGTVDGSGGAAQFNNPSGIAVDSSGNVFVADTGNNTIRKINSSSGQVITLAGSPGQCGNVDGPGAGAQFASPMGIAVDNSLNLYVADTGNNTIRKVTSGGVVSTLAGTPYINGFMDGPGTGALFNSPSGVAVDASGNVVVADTLNNRIRKVTPDGVVTTVAGSFCFGSFDGIGSDATFNMPSAVAVDGAGNIYVADTYNVTLRMIAPGGGVTTLSGSTCTAGFTDGVGTAAKFNFPGGIAVDSSGNLYVADTGNHTIRKKISTSVITVAGSAPKIGLQTGYIGQDFYVATPYGAYNYPTGIAVDPSGNVFSVDTQNQNILRNGIVVLGTMFQQGNQDGTGGNAYFNFPQGIAVDSGSNLYVADTRNHSIRMVSPTFVSTTICGGSASMGSADGTGTNAMFNNPVGIALDSGTNLYVADTYNSTIRKLTRSGAVWTATTIAGSAQVTGTTDGTSALFAYPSGVAVDSGTNVYVSDSGNGTIRMLTFSGGTWSSQTIAGTPGVTGTADGVGAAAQFGYPTMMSLDNQGNLFVVDTGNNTIRMLTNLGGGNWGVTTVGGTPGVSGGISGVGVTGSQVRFSAPGGIAVVSSSIGTDLIYVMDTANNQVVLGALAGTGTVSGLIVGGATLNGAANPNGQPTSVYFQYGKTTAYGSVTGTQSIGSGSTVQSVSSSLTGLSANTTYDFRLVTVNASGTFYGLNQVFVTTPSAVSAISSATTITGTNGYAFSYTITATNSPTGFAVNSLPPGLSLNPFTGAIYGIPTVTASTNAIVSITNPVGTGSANVIFKMIDLPLPVFTSSGSVQGIYGSSFNYAIAATNGIPMSYNATGLPAGWTVDSSSGLINGIPTTVGTNWVTLMAINATGTSSMPLLITVTPPYVWSNFAGHPGVSGTASGMGINALFTNPEGIAVDSGSNIYVADTFNRVIRKITPSGLVSTLAGSMRVMGITNGTGTNAQFNTPAGIAVDSGSNVYVADTNNNMIRMITPSGVVTTLAGQAGMSGTANGTGTNAQFYLPFGIAVDSGSNVYVGDYGNNMIRKITPAGTVSTLAGSTLSGTANGTGSSAQFYNPKGVAVDSGSNVYVVDYGNYTIRKVTSAGVVTTLAGTPKTSGSLDGVGTNAQFYYPVGITVDSGSNLYVSDFENFIIRKITQSNGVWTVTTIGGSARVGGSSDGIGAAAQFYYPFAIAVNSDGNLFVADSSNQRISMGSIIQVPTISSALTASGTNGQPFSYSITSNNAPVSYNMSGSVSGLSINLQTGLISGTPNVSGTFSFGISAINLAGTGTATLTLSLMPGLTAYQTWQGVVFSPSQMVDSSISGDLLAPAGDGISNLMKYALHLNPFVNGVSGLPVESMVSINGSNYPTLTYTAVIAATDLTYTVEVSTDLQTWNSGPSYTATVNVTANPDGVTQSIVVRSLVSISGGAPKQFLRLRVSH